MSRHRLSLRAIGLVLATALIITCSACEAAPTPDSAPKPTPTTMPTSTPTPDPCTGWWCAVQGIVYADRAEAGNEVEGALVRLGQYSHCSPTSGQYETTTGLDGAFEFDELFLHDTDRIWIQVELEGYEEKEWAVGGFDCVSCSCLYSPVEIVLHAASD